MKSSGAVTNDAPEVIEDEEDAEDEEKVAPAELEVSKAVVAEREVQPGCVLDEKLPTCSPSNCTLFLPDRVALRLVAVRRVRLRRRGVASVVSAWQIGGVISRDGEMRDSTAVVSVLSTSGM